MKYIPIVVPILATACFTTICVFLAIWLTGLVPDGDWAALIRALIVIAVVVGSLLAIAWSAYFSLIIRRSLKDQYPRKE